MFAEALAAFVRGMRQTSKLSSMQHRDGAERRKFGRKETNVDALAVAPGRCAVRCTIKNISRMGALLEFAVPFTCRSNFRLYVEGNKLDAQCQIRRQDGTAVGVEFVAIAVHGMIPPQNDCCAHAHVIDGPHKCEPTANSGVALRARLFGAPVATD